jgi:membrane protease subunit (stomatin/prohibitin family)
MSDQGLLRKGIYEYSDPSATLLATRIPASGSADLYSGTVVVVRPNQSVIFVYGGKITEVLDTGTHEIHTENFPLLTKLANWKFGFESPLRCELWFISQGLFSGRLWGTDSPVLLTLPTTGAVPVRVHGNANIRISDAKGFFIHFLNGQTSYDITDLETFIQAQMMAFLPNALKAIEKIQDLNTKQTEVGAKLENLVNAKLKPYGVQLEDIQIKSILPPDEVLEALDQKLAMDVIGDKRDYLLYKVANSLDHMKSGPGQGGDQTQLLMSMMLGKSLLGDGAGAATAPASLPGGEPTKTSAFNYVKCPACLEFTDPHNTFCPKCGAKV